MKICSPVTSSNSFMILLTSWISLIVIFSFPTIPDCCCFCCCFIFKSFLFAIKSSFMESFCAFAFFFFFFLLLFVVGGTFSCCTLGGTLFSFSLVNAVSYKWRTLVDTPTEQVDVFLQRTTFSSLDMIFCWRCLVQVCVSCLSGVSRWSSLLNWRQARHLVLYLRDSFNAFFVTTSPSENFSSRIVFLL